MPTKLFNLLWKTVCVCIWKIFLGRPNLANTNWWIISGLQPTCCPPSSQLGTYYSNLQCTSNFHYIDHKNICANHLPQPGWHLVGYSFFSCSCVFWYFRQVKQCLTALSILTLMFTQYTVSCISNLIFSIPLWLLCSWLDICFCNWEGIVIHLPLTTTPSIMANSCLMGQCFCMSCATSSFLCRQPHMIVWYMPGALAGVHIWLLSLVYILWMYTGRPTAVMIVLTFMFGPHISIFVLFMVVVWYPICNKYLRTWLIYYVYPVLMNM